MYAVLIAIGLVALSALAWPVLLALRKRNVRLAWTVGAAGLAVQAGVLGFITFGIEGHHDVFLALFVGFPVAGLAMCLMLTRAVRLSTRESVRE